MRSGRWRCHHSAQASEAQVQALQAAVGAQQGQGVRQAQGVAVQAQGLQQGAWRQGLLLLLLLLRCSWGCGEGCGRER